MTVVQAEPRHAAAKRAAPGARVDSGGFRGDIQGLRAIAVLLVLGFHAGVPWLSGGFVGVDVFFVISGFLITGLIVREVEATGRLDLRRFWARRVRRLLPATAVTLAAVAAITVTVLPFTRWPAIAGDMAASAAYVVNWRLASGAVDYLAAEAAPSPVQHFWSLAVEEQFYIIWPLLIVALMVLARRQGWTLRRTLFVGISVLALGSLVWSAYLTSADPGRAYFVSTTRAWELAIGAALALVAPHVAQLTRGAATALGWLGLAAIMYAGMTYDSATAFPGTAALVPTLGAAAVIAAGIRHTQFGVDKFLSVGAMQDIGTLSYSLYLWHWPVLVGAAAAWGDDDGTLALPIALIAVGFSAVPAWLTYRIVEAPIHQGRFFRSMPRAAALGAGCTAIGVAAAVVVSTMVPGPEPQSQPEAQPVPDGEVAPAPSTDVTGAGILETVDDPASVIVDQAGVTLDPLAAVDDNAPMYGEGCHQDQESDELLSCAYGDTESDTVIALVGDSHAAQWQPALDEIATQRRWRLETYTKSACGFFTVDVVKADDSPYPSCSGWNSNLREHLTGPDAPDLVIASSSVAQRVIEDDEPLADEENSEQLARGMRSAWDELEEAGTEVVVIRDTPRRGFDTPECVAENMDRLTECTSELGDTYSNGVDARAAENAEDIGWIEMTPYICPGDVCPAVIGNVIVWRDRHHMTASYVRSLAPYLDRSLREADIGTFADVFSG